MRPATTKPQSARAKTMSTDSSGGIISKMKEYALVDTYPPVTLINVKDFKMKIDARYVEMIERGGSQHIPLGKVTVAQYHEIKEYRDEHASSLLFSYFSAIETLIVKIPGSPHEKLHRNFGGWIRDIRAVMGVPGYEFHETGSQTYKSQHNPPASYFSENGDQLAAVPSLITDIKMDHSVTPAVIKGAPLTFEFSRVFGRAPAGPREADFVLTGPMLDTWATQNVW